MELREAQISEIKNLKLIYVFQTDSIFKGESNKYVGIKIVFDKNKVLSLDYKDKHFSEFIKRVLERYQKEHSKRKIILLGDLSKKLINDSSFVIEDKKKEEATQLVGLPSYNTTDRTIKKYESYLKEALGLILQVYKNYEVLDIESITGFNNRYILKYNVGIVKKQLPLIVDRVEDDLIEFRLGYIDGTKAYVSGTISNEGGKIDINWSSKDKKTTSKISYNVFENTIERKVISENQTVIYDEDKDTILEEDISLIDFYYSMFNINVPKHIMKIDDNSFLMGDSETLSEEDQNLLYKTTSSELCVRDDEIIIRHREKTGFNKYNNQISTVLDEIIDEITIKKMSVDERRVLLVEKKHKTDNTEASFTYEILEINEDVDLRKPFNIEERKMVSKELKTLEQAKQYVKEHKGGRK